MNTIGSIDISAAWDAVGVVLVLIVALYLVVFTGMYLWYALVSYPQAVRHASRVGITVGWDNDGEPITEAATSGAGTLRSGSRRRSVANRNKPSGGARFARSS